MVDHVGTDSDARRVRIGVVIPSTNTSVEADYNDLKPASVSFHVARIYMGNIVGSDMDAQRALQELRDGMDVAVRDVMTSAPDHLVLGMSSETFVGGLKGSTALTERMVEISGLGVTTGSEATRQILDLIGAKRIAVLTPYQPSVDEQVERYFDDLGFELAAMKSLRCPTALSIAEVSGEEIMEALRQLDEMSASEVDAFVQVGTNLSSHRIADRTHSEFGRPLIGINAATVWHALTQLRLEANLPLAGPVFSESLK